MGFNDLLLFLGIMALIVVVVSVVIGSIYMIGETVDMFKRTKEIKSTVEDILERVERRKK